MADTWRHTHGISPHMHVRLRQRTWCWRHITAARASHRPWILAPSSTIWARDGDGVTVRFQLRLRVRLRANHDPNPNPPLLGSIPKAIISSTKLPTPNLTYGHTICDQAQLHRDEAMPPKQQLTQYTHTIHSHNTRAVPPKQQLTQYTGRLQGNQRTIGACIGAGPSKSVSSST